MSENIGSQSEAFFGVDDPGMLKSSGGPSLSSFQVRIQGPNVQDSLDDTERKCAHESCANVPMQAKSCRYACGW